MLASPDIKDNLARNRYWILIIFCLIIIFLQTWLASFITDYLKVGSTLIIGILIYFLFRKVSGYKIASDGTPRNEIGQFLPKRISKEIKLQGKSINIIVAFIVGLIFTLLFFNFFLGLIMTILNFLKLLADIVLICLLAYGVYYIYNKFD